MDCLELNIHQRILSDIASSPSAAADVRHADIVISSRLHTKSRPDGIGGDFHEEPATEHGHGSARIFLTASRVHCNIAFGELVVNLPDEYVATSLGTIMSILTDIMTDIPFTDFDRCLSWQDWALPDQLVYSTVTALLHLSSNYSQCASQAVSSISVFLSEIVAQMSLSSPFDILTQFAPALHGLYRAISSTPYPWTLSYWEQLTERMTTLCSADNIDRLNRLGVDLLQRQGTDADMLQFIKAFVTRYIDQGRPLSGYFIVCCIVEMEWTILAQVLAPPPKPSSGGCITEAAAANKAWLSMMRQPVSRFDFLDEKIQNALKKTTRYAMQCFTDLLVQIEEMDSEPSIDTYAWETMSESLKLASVCSVVLGELDEKLHLRLLQLLSDQSPLTDNLVLESALKATTVLVQNFPDIAGAMANHLRRFVTSTSPIFEFEFASESRAPPLSAAAKCLALCIKFAPGDDLIMSNMYSLLNYIAATSKEMHDNSSSNVTGLYGIMSHSTTQLLESGLHDLSEDERRLLGITTISVVTRLALEFQMEEVTRLTISMLLQRLRFAEPTVEAAISYNLVDLALSAPENAFRDIIRAFSTINRSANPGDQRFSNNMVLAAQTRLAQEVHRRPELYETYLIELLTLFADKGVAIQNLKISDHSIKTDDMIEQLASLLLPIDALLSHEDFNPRLESSPGTVSLFRNMWFLCTLFHFSFVDEKEETAMDWLKPALAHIAAKTPSLVLEEAHDSVASDVEYNSVIRQEYAQTVILKHRQSLTKHISLRAPDIRSLSSGQVVFLLTMHDMESMRSAAGLTSSLASYFVNDSINKNPALSGCMESVAEKVIRGCINDLNTAAAQQNLPECLSSELRHLLVYSTHRVEKAREVAMKYLNRLITSFPSLMCDPLLVFAILEVLTLLRRACENEFIDEFNPIYEFYSERANITLQLTDNYKIRNDILSQLHRNATTWFELALGRAPVELQSTLQKYLAISQSSSGIDSTDLGASLAEHYGKAIGPVQRQLTSLAILSHWETDRAKVLASQIAMKGYFAGEAAGIRLAGHEGLDKLGKLPPQTEPSIEIEKMKAKMIQISEEIKTKQATLTVQDLKRLLFRCAGMLISLEKCEYEMLHHIVALPFEVATPTAIAAGIEVWTWIIAEKPDSEVALMSEILSAWSDTIRDEKGIFSSSMNYDDPFYHPIEYSPTDKVVIDRGTVNARRMLAPLALVLQMLLSRLQAARYRRPALMFLIQHLVLRSARSLFSTHALAREARFSFLLFGFETLKSSYLDPYCENLLRENLYALAYSWFAIRPQWSYGSSRVQVDADVKVLAEFLSYLQADSARGSPPISSLSPTQLPSRSSYYANRVRELGLPLRLLTENEIIRMNVWNNPTNDVKRGIDHVGTLSSTLLEATWPNIIRTVWQINPAIAIHLPERFKLAIVRTEVSKLSRASPQQVLGIPEALPFFLGDRFDASVHRDFRHLLLWDPVPPVIANTFFERRFHNEPHILQYAHRVLEQHPVDVTFFFVPQVVQALRYDGLGYVARFIFETAKISQLFCHQIVWNMKANCYKDDLAEIEDPMKPILDDMIECVVSSLSGDAREFYDREFKFFNEVTSISGKLKPYIRKTKPEKKAKIDEEMAKITVDVGVYLPSNPDGKVVDIDKKSGRPLQSHAKAPFMATFKVRKQRVDIDTDPESVLDGEGAERRTEYDIWLQAIFKVGDDCRQDVLALQVIAMFKNIFTNVGLMLYLYPYRVTATGPGCGIIDVVPNATSRDEMGRAKVNDLLDFFVARYGGPDTVAFQQARLNFIQSMAAYSVACFILQIKDRHNGNIMIDGEGHIVHVDFGFLFDIDKLCHNHAQEYGVKFEPSSFKLNHEMVVLMGGRYSQGYQLFQQLTVKAFLAIRPHVEQIISTVQLMLDTGLPSFKGEPTIRRLRERFALHLNERQAAEYMMAVIRNAHENVRSTVYDEFQRVQNGIPYK